MGDAEYEKRAKNVQSFVPFLENIITQLKSPKMKNREQQLVKMESLYEMITDKRKKLKLETLIKCEDVIVKLYQKVKGEKGESSFFNAKSPEFEDRREKRKPPDIYSAAAQTLPKSQQNEVTPSSTATSLSSADQQPKSFFLRKPPISYADLEILEKDVASELEKKLSLNELNNLRNSLCEQLDIDTTVRNKATLSKVVTASPAGGGNTKKKDEKKNTTPAPPKIIRESDELFGNAFQELDKKYASSAAATTSTKKQDTNIKKVSEDEDKMALQLAEKAKQFRNKKDREKEKKDRENRDKDKKDRDKKDRDKERKNSKDRDKRSKDHKKDRDKDKQKDSKEKEGDKKETARDKEKDRDTIKNKDKANDRNQDKEKDIVDSNRDKEKDSKNPVRDKEKNSKVTNRDNDKGGEVTIRDNVKDSKDFGREKEKDVDSNKVEDEDSKETNPSEQEIHKDKKVEEVKPALASRDPRLKFGANVAVVTPRQTTPLSDRLAFKYNPKPRRDAVVESTTTMPPQQKQDDFFSPASPDDDVDKGAVVSTTLLNDPKVNDALATLKGLTTPRVYDDSTPPVLEYHGGGAGMNVASQNLNPPLLTPYEDRPTPATSSYQGVGLNYSQSPRYLEEELYGRRFNVVQQQQQQQQPQRFIQQQQQQNCVYYPQQQQQPQYGGVQNFDYYQQKQQNDYYQQQQQQQQFFGGNRDPRMLTRTPYYQPPTTPQTPYYPPAPAPRMTYKEYKEQRERELHVQHRERDKDASSGEKLRSRRDVERRDVERRPRSRERYRSASRYRYNKNDGEQRDRERRDAASHTKERPEKGDATSSASPLDSLYAVKSTYNVKTGKGYGANFKIPKKVKDEKSGEQTKVKIEVIEEEEDKNDVVVEVMDKVAVVDNSKDEKISVENKSKEEEESILSKFFQNLIKTSDEDLKKRTLVSLIESVPGFSEEQKKKITSIIIPEEKKLEVVAEDIKEEEQQQEEKKEEVKEKKKPKTELDRLHEDIREMFIRDGVVTATGKRMCRIINASPKKTTKAPTPPPQPKTEVEMKELSVVLPKVSLDKIKEEEDERRYSLRKAASKPTYNEEENVKKPVEKPTTVATPSPKVGSAKKKKNAWATGIIRKKKRRKDPDLKVEQEIEDLGAVHDREYYQQRDVHSMTCKLCSATSRWISAHYRTQHPTVEVLSSRPSPDVGDDAIRDSLEHDEYKDETNVDTTQQRQIYACLFCDYSLSSSPKYFYDHVTIHTGEFRHKCSLCDYERSNLRSIQSHLVDVHKIEGSNARRKIVSADVDNFTNLYGFLCGVCNFTQLSHDALVKHVECHGDAERRIYKIKLNKSVDEKLVSAPPSQDDKVAPEAAPDQKEEDADTSVERRATRSRRRKSASVDISPPAPKQARIDVAVFTSNTDLVEENKQIEAERLKTMQSINETLLSKQQRNSLDIVEKLREKLLEEEEVDTSEMDVEQQDVDVVEPENDAELPPVNLPMYEKIQQKSTHLDANTSVGAEKPNRIICAVIEKLQGNLGATAEIREDVVESDEDSAPQPPPLPPLVHVSDVKPDVAMTTVSDRVTLNVGAIEIIKQGEEYVYTCRASPCVYATRQLDAFVAHCATEHAWNKTLEQYERCGECGAEFSKNCDRLTQDALAHARQQHSKFFGIKYGAIRISSNLFAAASTTDSKENEVGELATQQVDDNPFSFKIVDVISLAEVDGVESDVEGASTDAKIDDVVPKPDEKAQRKSAKALKIFLECYADLFKCSEYDCSFTTNKRKMFDIHMTMHANQQAKFATCIYCEKYFTFENLGAHYEKIHGRCKYQCIYCLYRCLVPEYMEVHQALEHPDLPYEMILLPKREEEKNLTSIFKEYAKTTLQPVRYACCDANFLYIDAYERHVTACPKNPYFMCHHRKGPKVCMKIHDDVASLVDHWGDAHDAHPYKCGYCDVGRRDVTDVMIHQATSHPALPSDVEDRTTSSDVKNPNNLPKARLNFEKLVADLRLDPARYAEATRLLVAYAPPPFVTPSPVSTTPNSGTSSPTPTTTSATKSVATYSKVNPSINVVVKASPTTSMSTKNRPKIRVLPTSVLKISAETEQDKQQSPSPTPSSTLPLGALDDEPLVTIETTNNDVDVDAVDPLSLDVVPATTTSSISSSSTGEKSGLRGHQLYRCAKCMLAFADHVMFKEHLVKSGDFCKSGDTAYKPYKCAHCGKYVKSLANLLDHIMYHGVVRFACSLCDCKFPHGLQARHHMKTKHNVFSVVMQPTTPGRANLARDEFIVKPQSSAKMAVSSASTSPSPAKDDTDVDNQSTQEDVTKTVFFSHEADEIPQKSILSYDVTCGHCKTFKNKVRSNIVRHLLLHQNDKDFQVPDIAPVNPVPCLEKNEKMFDKMYNLASSSHVGGRMGGAPKSDAKIDKKTGRQKGDADASTAEYPAYVASTKRFQCCAIDCNYLCLEEGNLRHHLTALHQEELIFVCVHCKRDLSDAPDVDAILKHLKLHDLHLYKCSQCDFLHNLRHKVARHVDERHPKIKDVSVVVIRAMDSEPYEETHYPHHQHPQIVTSAMTDAVVKSSKRWRCSMCKYRSDAKWQTDQHVKNKHDVECRFKCSWCSYKSDVETSFAEHFADQHPGREVDVVAAYYEETETQQVNANDATNSSTPDATDETIVDFDTTPLWLRDKPRVRHIRGILLDENTATTSLLSTNMTSMASVVAKPTRKIAATSPAAASSSSSSPKKRKRSIDVRPKIEEENIDERRRDNKTPKPKNDVEEDKETEIIVVDDDDIDKQQQSQQKKDSQKQEQQQQQRKKQTSVQELDDIDLLCIYGDVGMPEDDAFKCPKCDALKTTSVGEFVRHVAKEIAYERYICDVCCTRFVTLDEARSHRAARHGDDPAASLKLLRIDKNKRRWLTILIERQRAIIANLGFKIDDDSMTKDFEEYFKERSTSPPKPIVEHVVINEQQQQQEKLFTKDKYRCDRCAAVFNSVPEFEFHAKEKHGDSTQDVKYTVQAEDLTPMMLVNVENTRNAMRCAYCPQTSSSKIQLEAHAAAQHPGLVFQAYRFRCAVCDSKAETIKTLRTHYRKQHADLTELRYYDLSGKLIKSAGLIKLKIYRCPQCSYVGQSHNATNIRMHLRLHAKPFLCLLCDTEFKTRPDARTHHAREHPHNTEMIHEQPGKFAKIQEIMKEILKNVQEVEDDDEVEETKQQHQPQPPEEEDKKKKMFYARKSTSSLAPVRDVIIDDRDDDIEEQEWSFYGQKPETVDLSKISTNFEIADAQMQMSCQQLARIYKLNPKVVVEKL